jgi:DNA modification methylase
MRNDFVIEVKSGPNTTTHSLLLGDCLERTNDISKESIDLIITDPPYNTGLEYDVYKDNMNEEEFIDYLIKRLEKSIDLLSERGSIYIITYPEIAAQIFIHFKNKLKFRRWITWHYPTNMGHSKKNFTRSQRTILFFTKSNKYIFNRQNLIQHYKNPEVRKIKERLNNGSKGRTSYDLLRFLDLVELQKGMIDTIDINLLKNVSKDRMRKINKRIKNHHPCQLPIGLLKLLISVSSNIGDIVFDPFAGTFTISKAASELGRKSIGIELSRRYVKMGIKRLSNG